MHIVYLLFYTCKTQYLILEITTVLTQEVTAEVLTLVLVRYSLI